MGQDGLRAAQQHHKGGQKCQPAQPQQPTQSKGGKKAGGGKPCGSGIVLAAQASGDDGACTVSQHEPQRLDDGHQAGDHPHSAGSAGRDLPYKKSVGQVVDAGDQHTEDGGPG